MTRRELDAATITDPALRTAFEGCRRLNARHGKTYFLATRLLPASRRPAVHALYAFARLADDIVDDLAATSEETGDRAQRLQALSYDLRTAINGGSGRHPVVTAVAHTAHRYRIPHSHFDDFLASMRSDLTVTDYGTLDALRAYMHGSAAVIGLQMLPVLGHVTPGMRPPRTPPPWARHSSSPTSSATSAKTSTATASTCPPTSSPPRAWTGNCSAGADAPGETTPASPALCVPRQP